MSAHQVTYYQVKCDCCGYIETDYGDYTAWPDPDLAREEAPYLWDQVGDKDLCPECSNNHVRMRKPHPTGRSNCESQR